MWNKLNVFSYLIPNCTIFIKFIFLLLLKYVVDLHKNFTEIWSLIEITCALLVFALGVIKKEFPQTIHFYWILSCALIQIHLTAGLSLNKSLEAFF